MDLEVCSEPVGIFVEAERALALRHGVLYFSDQVDESTVLDLSLRLEWAAAEIRRLDGYNADAEILYRLDPDAYFKHRPDRFTLVLDTPGGSIHAGLAFAAVLARVKRLYGFDVDIEVSGCAASCGMIMLQCATGRRRAYANTVLMYHGPSVVVQGTSAEVYKDGAVLDKMHQDSISKIFADRNTGTEDKHRTAAFWKKELFSKSGRHTWLTAQQALQLGLIDEIV